VTNRPIDIKSKKKFPSRKKIPGGKKPMDSRSKVYHIYAKDECLYNNLTEQQFNKTWNTLKGMVGLMQTDYQLEDLTYEEVYSLPTNTEHSC
jgi:hypothetical protein